MVSGCLLPTLSCRWNTTLGEVVIAKQSLCMGCKVSVKVTVI